MGVSDLTSWLSTFEWSHVAVVGTLLLLIFLYETNKTFYFYCKYIFVDVLACLTALVFLPFFLVRWRCIENASLACSVLRFAYKCYGIQWEVRGREHLEAHRSYILMSNHQSKLDVLAIAHFLPPRTTALAKREILYTGPFGFAAWLCNCIFVDRSNHERAIETMRNTGRLIRDSSIRVLIFPEGTRNAGTGFLPFKKGGFHLALEGGLPIVPVVMSSYHEWLNVPARRFLPNGRVIVTCLPPVVPTSRDNVNDLMETTRRAMLEVYHQTTAELSASGTSSRATQSSNTSASSSATTGGNANGHSGSRRD